MEIIVGHLYGRAGGELRYVTHVASREGSPRFIDEPIGVRWVNQRGGGGRCSYADFVNWVEKEPVNESLSRV